MLNTVVELAGEPFAEVAAWLDHRGRPVETMGVVIGRLESGALVTLHGSGEMGYSVCESDIRVFCEKAMLRTGMWAEFLEVQREGGKLAPVPAPPSLGVWEQFLDVRAGRLPNPSPPAVGLRMARLYDAIKDSAAQDGKSVRC
jgi:predicted dehydrogenase